VANSRKLKSPYMTVKLLNSLKGFYTLKELEKILGINSHILWRYTALINIPEKKTSNKIIGKTLENNLIEKIVNKVISINSRGYVETWRYLYDVHFLGIVGYEVARFVNLNQIDTVFVFPEEDAPLALAVSEWLKCKVCVGFSEAKLSLRNYLSSSYISLDRGKIVHIYVPRGIIEEGDEVILVKNIAKNWDSLRAVVDLLNYLKASIYGIFVVVSLSNEWKEKAIKYGITNIKVLKEIIN